MRDMATCPRCGRDADDEFVCAGCGAFLAGDETEATTSVAVGRVALLVLIVCLLGAGGAAWLLNSGGGGHRTAGSIPIVSSPVELSSVPLGAPSALGSSASGQPRTSLSVSASATKSRTPSP